MTQLPLLRYRVHGERLERERRAANAQREREYCAEREAARYLEQHPITFAPAATPTRRPKKKARR